ncbi:MAG TPA: VCBS repeat-containing protein, partial [Pirellulaceae bacterium]|nr:VCBS repeat-containing protein [Pirellulaceae bacterium]
MARDVGVDFVFRNGGRSETAGEFMYEFSGGAAAVLDFDRDGWPDLYLSQGADWPPSADQKRFLDQLYRNQGDGRFVEVAGTAGIFENGFSQGVAVGDFDNDGFPDLYVGNIGPNRLFRNNGDGTFDDVTVESGTAGDSWTTSCAMADLNGDGMPDLYVTNYLADDRLFDKPCLMPDGSPRLCTPHEFPAAQDRLYLNLGDGRFVDVTEKVGIKVPDGKGLGVVVGDFDGSGRLGVFVANDAVPNFLFMSDVAYKPGESTPFALSEQAFVAGVAVDGEGRAQACMGVALGDADGDGRLDIFVTNFRNESNTLYVSKTPPDATSILFVDDTRRAGLRAPSFEMLGFGTQFLDADLDGREDLVVTNGHVGDLRHHGVEYMMRPQFFRNIGQGRYAELRGDEIGPFFDEKHLGRGLAKWDWNRDGRPDFVVNQLQEPAAILTNETSRPGHFLDVRLSGTRSSRDAIGTRVRAVIAGPDGREHI